MPRGEAVGGPGQACEVEASTDSTKEASVPTAATAPPGPPEHRLSIRVPRELHDELAELAWQRRSTVSELVRQALEQRFGATKREQRAA